MNLLRHFIEELRKGHESDPWHGPSTKSLLQGLTAVQAAARSTSAHSIWEIVLHMDAWQREVSRRLNGSVPELPLEGDWRPVRIVSEESWEKTQNALGASLREVISALQKLSESELEHPVGDEEDRAAGTGVNCAVMITGLIQHNAYHSGQIAVLRKMLEAS